MFAEKEQADIKSKKRNVKYQSSIVDNPDVSAIWVHLFQMVL